MSLLAMVALPLLGYPMVRLGQRLRRASTASQENMALVANRLTESVGGVKVVQGFGMEQYEIGRFREAVGRMLRADLRAGRARRSGAGGDGAARRRSSAARCSTSPGYYIARGDLDPGNFAVVLFCLGLLFMSIRRLNAVYAEIQQRAGRGRSASSTCWTASATIRDLPDARPLPPFSERDPLRRRRASATATSRC